MARTINAGEGTVSRENIYRITPSSVLADWANNGRTDEVPADALRALAADIRTNGQLQPILVRKVEDHRVKVVAGFTRLRACQLIEKDDPKFLIMCHIVDVNDEEAFVLNVRENAVRNETTAIDDAVNIRKLTQNYGWSLERCGSELYGKSASWAAEMLRLLTLPAAIRSQVSNDEITVSAALMLGKLPEAQAQAIAVQAAAEAAAEHPVPDTAPLPDEEVDSEIAASIAGLPRAKKQPTERAGKPMKQANAEKAAKAAKKKTASAKIAKAVRATGKVKVTRSGSDLRKILEGREDAVSKSILAYLDGSGDEADLNRALDVVEDVLIPPPPAKVLSNGRAKLGPVASL